MEPGSSPSIYRARRRAWLPPRVGVPAAFTLAVFLLGPRVQVDESVLPVDLGGDPGAFIVASEGLVPGVRPGDGKDIVWADPELRARTSLSLVYLHGFSADRHEIDPVPERVAAALGANLFHTRLAGHGRNGAAMAEATVGDWLQDVEEALTVGSQIGDGIVVMGTSTGGTLALWAAMQERWRGELHALVLVSPNLQVRDRNARLALWPWGGAIVRLLVGQERCFQPVNEEHERHWTTCYPSSALLPMVALVERARTFDFESADTPMLVLYSPDDEVVDPAGTARMFDRYGAARKERRIVSGSGDPADHVLAGDVVSPETTDEVVDMILDFLEPADVPSGGG